MTPTEAGYTVDPIDREMEVVKRTNVRAGPGTGYEVLGTVDPGVGVRVTGEVRGLDRVRVELREDGGAAFMYAPLLKDYTPETPPVDQLGLEWTMVTNQPCRVWNYGEPEHFEPATWSGSCVNGKASGEGQLMASSGEVYEGGMLGGKQHGYGTLTFDDGAARYKGEYRDGLYHGRGTFAFADSSGYEGEYRDGKFHGRGTYTFDNSDRYDGEYRDGKRHRRGTYTFADGNRMACEWRNGDEVDGTCEYH